jgi:vacuolar protein sorting-associated protein 53
MTAIGGQALNDLRSWYCQFFLEPYRELFEPGKPNATFDNTKRRFAWYKRTVKEADSQYSDLFPEAWQMNELIAYEFCRMTKLHLDQILSASFTEIDVQLIIETMQMSTEFENELHKKFS